MEKDSSFNVGDLISIGNDNHKLTTVIEGFVKYGVDELVQTPYGEFNISLIKKAN